MTAATRVRAHLTADTCRGGACKCRRFSWHIAALRALVPKPAE